MFSAQWHWYSTKFQRKTAEQTPHAGVELYIHGLSSMFTSDIFWCLLTTSLNYLSMKKTLLLLLLALWILGCWWWYSCIHCGCCGRAQAPKPVAAAEMRPLVFN